MWWSQREVRCPLGISGCMRDWPQGRGRKKQSVWKREDESERKWGEPAPCAVQYNLALWFLSRGHVANFPTAGIHFLYFTFPWTTTTTSSLPTAGFALTLPASHSRSSLIFSFNNDKGEHLPRSLRHRPLKMSVADCLYREKCYFMCIVWIAERKWNGDRMARICYAVDLIRKVL